MAKSSGIAMIIIALVLSTGTLGGGVYMFFFYDPPVVDPPVVSGITFVHTQYSEPTSGWYVVDFNAYSGYGLDANLTSNTITILEEGKYDVDVCVNFYGSDIDHYYGAYLRLNDTGGNLLVSQVRGTGAYATASVSCDIFFHAGDVLILYVYSSETGFIIQGDDTDRYTFFSLHKI